MSNIISPLATFIPTRWRRLAIGCIGLSALGAAISGLLVLLPMFGLSIGEAGPLEALPVLTAFLGLFAGALSLVVLDAVPAPAEGHAAAEAPTASFSGLYAMVQELSAVLAEERDKAGAFEEVFCTAVREVRVVSAGVAHLTQAALDAEARLSAGVAHADSVLREAASGDGQRSEAVQQNQHALPEIAERIRQQIAEQSRKMSADLEAMAERMTVEADGPVEKFRSAAAEAAEQLKTLGDTAGALRQDVSALDAAGRETAVANAKMVARLNTAVGQIEASAAYLPEAAAAVAEGVRQAADVIAEASLELRANGAALETSSNDNRQAAAAMQLGAAALTSSGQALESSGAQLGEALANALAEMPAAAATVTAAADQAVHTLAEASGELQADGVALEASRTDTRLATVAIQVAVESLTAKAHGLESAGSQFGKIVAQALAGMPAAAATMTAAANQVAQEGAALVERGHDTQRATATLAIETDRLKATGQSLAEAGHLTIATVAKAAEMAIAQLAAVIIDAEGERESLTSFANRAAALESLATTLVDNAYRLDEAGQRSAAAGERVASRLDLTNVRSEALLHALPEVAAAMDTAAAGLRHETSTLATAAQQVSTAVKAATSAVADVATRAETAATSLDTAGRLVSSASAAAQAHADRLAGVAQRAETQAPLLPEAANLVNEAAKRLQAVVEAWQSAPMLTQVAERVEAAVEKLDDRSSAVPAEESRLEILTAIADVGASARRVEAALVEHDRLWPSVVASIAQVEAAAAAVAQAAASSDSPRVSSNLNAAGAPAGVADTLRHFDEVASQSQILLRQAEGLAEAVLSGRAPGLPTILADHTPALLADIDTTTRRLRSVATALALASDGVATSHRRQA